MPQGKGYKMKIGKGASRTPSSVMGSQGSSTEIPQGFNKSKSTKKTKFPG